MLLGCEPHVAGQCKFKALRTRSATYLCDADNGRPRKPGDPFWPVTKEWHRVWLIRNGQPIFDIVVIHEEIRVGLALIAGLPLPVISAFMERYPEIQLDLDFTDRMVDVIDEGFDVVIRGSELQDSRLMSRPLGPYRSCLVACPSYLQKRGIPTKPADLLNHSCLHYRWQKSGKLYQWPFKKTQLIQSGESLSVTMVCSNVEALIYLAQAGRGIACVPDFAVKDSLAEGRFRKGTQQLPSRW